MTNKISEALNEIRRLSTGALVESGNRIPHSNIVRIGWEAYNVSPLADECVSVLKECVTELDHRGGGKTMKRARALLKKLEAGQ